MSDHHDTEDYTENKEKNETNNASPDETETEANEHCEFEEETLQITDVHAFEQTVGEFPVHLAAELSSSSTLWTSNDSPASVVRFLDQTPGIDTSHHGAVDLQSEFAALGLNSLYPSAVQDVDSSFEESFEKSIPSKNHSNIEVTGVNNDIVNSSANFIESNLDIIEDAQDEDSKVSFNKIGFPFDRNQALLDDLLSTAKSVKPLDDSIHHDHNIAKDSEEITWPNNPCVTAIMPDSNQTERTEVIDNFWTKDSGYYCISIQPSQSTFDDQSLEDKEQVCLSTNNTRQDNNYGNMKENMCHILNASVDFKLISDKLNYVENKQDSSNLTSEETDDVFVDAVDSFLCDNCILSPAENKLISCSNSNIVEKRNSVEEPEKIKEKNRMELFEKVEEIHQGEIVSGTDSIVEKTCVMRGPMSENVVKEICEVQQSSSEEFKEGTYSLENTKSKNYVFKKTQQTSPQNVAVKLHDKEESLLLANVEEIRSKEIVEQINAMEEYMSENDDKDTYKVQQTTSEDIVEEIHATVDFMPEVDIGKETQQVQQSSVEATVEETQVEDLFMYEDDVRKPHHIQLFSPTEIVAGIHSMTESMSMSKDNVEKEASFEEITKEIPALEESVSEKVVKEISPMKEYVSQINGVKENHKEHQSILEEVKEETHSVKEYNLKNDVFKQTRPTSTDAPENKIYDMEASTFEDNVKEISSKEIVDERHTLEENMSKSDVDNDTYPVQQTTSEDMVEETHAIVDFMSEVDVGNETHRVQHSSVEKVVEETQVVELAIYEYDVRTPHHIQLPCSTGTLTDIHSMTECMSMSEDIVDKETNFEVDIQQIRSLEESASENVFREINTKKEHLFSINVITEAHRKQQSTSENINEETYKVQESFLENDVIKQTSSKENEEGSYSTQEISFEDNVAKPTCAEDIVENIHAIKEHLPEIVVSEMCYVQETTSKEVVEEAHATVKFRPKDDAEEIHKVQQSSSEEVVKKTLEELPVNENDVRKPNHLEQSISIEIVKEILPIKQSISEDNVVNETTSADVVEEIHAMEESISVDNDNKTSYVVIVEDMHEMKNHIPENNVNETYQMQQTTSKDIIEETLSTVEFMFNVDVKKETHQVQQSNLEEVVEETKVVELSTNENGDRNSFNIHLLSSKEIVTEMHSLTESKCISKDNFVKETSFEEVIKEIHLLEGSDSRKNVEEISSMKEYVSQINVVKEAHQEQQSNVENITEEIHVVEDPILENVVAKQTYQVQQTSLRGVEESFAMEETTFEDNVTKDACAEVFLEDIHSMKECISKKDDKETNCTVESVTEDDDREIHHIQQSSFEDIHAMEDPLLENVVKEIQDAQQSNTAEPTERTHSVLKSISNKIQNYGSRETHNMLKSSPENVEGISGKVESLFMHNFVKETQQAQHTSCEEVMGETLAVERSEKNFRETHVAQQTSSDEIFQETQAKEASKFEIIFVEETRPMQYSGSEEVVEKTLAMGEFLSENSLNKDSCKFTQSKEFEKETHAFKDLMFDNRIKESLLVQLFNVEEVGEGTDEINEKVLDELPVIENTPIAEGKRDQSGFEETVFETTNKINSPKEHVSESKSSVTQEQVKTQTDSGSESSLRSFYSPRTLDMSLTIAGMPSDNQDSCDSSSESKEDRCKLPVNQLSQTLNDLLDNADIEDTNDFTAHSDQKMYDALYVPLPGCNDSTYSVSDNGLQSFMEITMANTNVAMIEQNFNNTTKQAELNQDQKTNKSLERSKFNESSNSSIECEEITPCSNNSNLLYDSDSNNKNHELMQQSMSDYVTNLSLELAIPDSCHFSNGNCADKETRQKCEEQAESVLLMKWPAQYHNNIEILKEQNHFLLESSNQKDTVINKLKLDNEDLLQKLSEVIAHSQNFNLENCALKNALDKGEHQIITLQQENSKLFQDLGALKNIESELFDYKIKNEEIIHTIEKNRLAKEGEITVLKDKIEELEHELLNIRQNVTGFQSNSLQISVLVESIQSKDNQIETLLTENSFLKERVTCLSTHLSTLDDLKQENVNLKDILQLEKEKNEDMDKLKIMVKKQNDDICGQNEKLSKLTTDLNEKEQEIQGLFKDKISLEDAVACLNNQLTELRKIEDENHQLKSNLQGEKEKREEMLLVSKSLEEQTCIQVENISKLNSEICEKDCQIKALTNINADLKNVLEKLSQRFEELKESEKENDKLKISIKQRDEQVKEINSLKMALEEQVSNLKAQNELLWNSLKVSSTKEQNLSALQEERLLLEEKLSQMKREIQEINNLKSDNKHLFDELTNKEDIIRNLTADKKKLKSSLIKANDKLNERDTEIESLCEQLQLLEERLNVLNEENTELENKLDKATKEETLRAELNNEILAENIGNISEYLSSVIFENAYLAEEIIVYDSEDKKLTVELMSLRKKFTEEKVLFESLQLEKESLVNLVSSLKKDVTLLTEELNECKYQCNEIILLKEENEILTTKINNLSESVVMYEDEKTFMFRDMSSLSETISSLLNDRQLLSEQLRHSSEISERLDVLAAEKCLLEQRIVQHEQNDLVLLQSISTLQNQLEAVKDQDKIIDELKDFSSGLEDHLSSMNEELMSEMSKNQFLCVTVNELESKFIQNNEESLMLQNKISSLRDQLNVSREKHSGLQELVADLEDHISSLNEELMSEIAKNQFLLLENESLECQKSEIIEEKLLLENIISHAIERIKNRLQNTGDVSNRQMSLQTYINKLLLEMSNFEDENVKLNHDINNFQGTLLNSNQSISDLLKDKQNLEIELSRTNEQKLELENRLTEVLGKESVINTLEKENEMLLKVAESHKYCENAKTLLQNERSDLEVQIQSLTEAINVLRKEQHDVDTQLKENVQLKEVMTKEIHSLTGEIWDFNLEPLIEVYQRLMKEFLNKEKEVIFSLQSDFECKIKITQDKIVSLKNELNEKDVLTSKLENEVEECKMHLNHRDTLISSLENDLFAVRNESNCAYKIEEMRLQAEKEKEILIAELKSVQQIDAKLQEKISILSNEVNSKNNEILQLKCDLEEVQCEKNNLLRRTEEDCGVSKHQKDLIDELTLKLNEKHELISQLDLQLQNKNNEISQLTKCLENKEIETRQYLMKIEEMTPAALKLNAIENEFDLIKNVTSLDEEFDVDSFVGSLQACKVFGDMTKLLVSKFVESLKQLQISNDNLKHELSNQIEVCKSLETQISDMNEELKSCKLLYDEDSLQFKEEIAAKNFALTNLTEALEQFKRKACLDADLKNECTEIESMKEELNKLKEENAKLQSDSTKITYLTGINRKLSWEIEGLSRSIKFEKQSNVDLKAKCDLATNQVADLSKKNCQLEDKIGDLERKLENHDVMSSLKIGFPLGINTLDKQVQYVKEKLAEFDQVNSKLNKLNDEHNSLKHEFEKSKEYIQKQEEKLCKIMKRELELKKQIASNLQTCPDIKILKELKAEILSLFPGESLSLSEVLLKIKSLLKEEKEVLAVDNTEIKDLKQKIEELSQDNKDLDLECEMMNKHIKEQEELLASVFKREEELKKLNAELKFHLPNHLQTNIDPPAADNNLQELFGIFSEKPASLKDSINLVKLIMHENQALKEKISESQEEYASLDKECEDMFKAYKEKEKDLADVLKREASSVSDLKNKQQELENELKALSEELQLARSQLIVQENPKSVTTPCQCEELKFRLSELKVDLAERNAKITALEMQFEADNFPLKKKVAELEKSLDQAKQKINELKSEVRRYREQMCDVTVGLRAECERCRSLGTAADPTALTTLQQQLEEKVKEIQILKALCRSRKQKIKELEDRDGSHKMPRSQRSALKEVKENQTVTPSPTKPSKGSH